VSEVPAGGNWFLGWKPSGPLDWLFQLRQGAPHSIRWFHPDDCHVTLAFFGRLSVERVREIGDRLATTAPEQIGASLGLPLLLPTPRRFSALAFFVESESMQNAIAEQRDQWMALAGLPAETRDPLPHLTFARPDRRAPFAQLRAIRAWMEKLPFPRDLPVTFEGPMLFTWSDDRALRQFKVVMQAGSNDPSS
jgi:2'-5' RNA ligase